MRITVSILSADLTRIKSNSRSELRMTKRRQVVKYTENPFLKEAFDDAKLGKKNIAVRTNNMTMMIKSETMDVPLGIHQVIDVDKTQFVKIYLEGIRALSGLKSAGLKIFEIVYLALMDKPHQTEIILNYDMIEPKPKMSKATFYRGVAELIEQRFLAESYASQYYFVNVAYIYNGDRIALIKEYRLNSVTSSKESKKIDSKNN